ncbi:hypothetical protein AB1Y20_020528 [Prymnesium parvum]|uniref:Transmembrane protein n=1 Tax=Prymnesium parvum TaxID=97485 RepID=A0AB34JTP9_PRYPA
MPVVMARKPRFRLWTLVLRSLVLGAFLGTANAIMVNCALIEISLSPFFALAFGFLFLMSGAAVGWQATLEQNGEQVNRTLLLCFAVLTTASGLVTFLLERDWSHGLTARHKVPLYGLLGVSLAFSINFSAYELVGRVQQCACEHSTPLVRTEWQVRLIAISSVITGLFFGLTFGVMDLEDEIVKSHFHMRLALQRESRICYPVGACAGTLSTLAGLLLELQAEANDADLAYIRNARNDSL